MLILKRFRQDVEPRRRVKGQASHSVVRRVTCIQRQPLKKVPLLQRGLVTTTTTTTIASLPPFRTPSAHRLLLLDHKLTSHPAVSESFVRAHITSTEDPSRLAPYRFPLFRRLSPMATEALLPLGAAYTGATQSDLDAAKAAAGNEYFPTVFNPATVHQKGRATIGAGRASLTKNGARDGFKLYYEVHGTGPIKVIFVMGLNNSCFGWLPQVEHLAKDAKYSCLVFDNRGVSNSETPAGWYKTSEMAQDAFELLQHVGWITDGSKKRSVHVAGVSMGGMIALEMAKQRPEVISSLTLISTAAGRRFRTPTYGFTSLARVLGGRVLGFDSEQYRLNRLITTLFPATWLAQTSTKDPQKRTNQQVLYDMFKWRFTFTTRQSLHGAVSQMKAALTHFIPDADLDRINQSVDQICILTGDEDYLVDPRNSTFLKEKLSRAELHQFTGAGHALGNQLADEVNAILEKVIAEGEDKAKTGA